MDEDHFLTSFLEEKLPTLGLDAETYGPYLMGLLPSDENEQEGADEEEWGGVLELLQASSETHSDNMDAWQELKQLVLERTKEHLVELEKRKEKAAEEARQREAELVKIPVVSTDAAAAEKKKKSAMDDAAKKAILRQYAYEADDPDGEEEEGGAVNVNKQSAQQLLAEKSQEMRSQKTTTKKDEQVKTKEAKQAKVNAKEERRNRATKGERKR